MLVYVYLFSFALGGILLLASILLGDKDTGHDDAGDADADADAGAPHQGLDHGVPGSHGGLAGVFTAFLSMRFWMFFVAFFGLTGLVLDGLDLVGSGLALALALAMGLFTGQATVAVFRHLATSETSTAAGAHDYVGKSGRVLVGFGPGELGKLRLTLKGTTVDVLATSDEEQRFAAGDSALVIQMNETTAVVAREPGRADA